MTTKSQTGRRKGAYVCVRMCVWAFELICSLLLPAFFSLFTSIRPTVDIAAASVTITAAAAAADYITDYI